MMEAPSSPTVVIEVNPNDVLLGRGTGPNDHPGNVTYRQLIQSHHGAYKSSTMRGEKAKIAKKVIGIIHQSNGRFLRRLEPGEEDSGIRSSTARFPASRPRSISNVAIDSGVVKQDTAQAQVAETTSSPPVRYEVISDMKVLLLKTKLAFQHCVRSNKSSTERHGQEPSRQDDDSRSTTLGGIGKSDGDADSKPFPTRKRSVSGNSSGRSDGKVKIKVKSKRDGKKSLKHRPMHGLSSVSSFSGRFRVLSPPNASKGDGDGDDGKLKPASSPNQSIQKPRPHQQNEGEGAATGADRCGGSSNDNDTSRESVITPQHHGSTRDLKERQRQQPRQQQQDSASDTRRRRRSDGDPPRPGRKRRVQSSATATPASVVNSTAVTVQAAPRQNSATTDSESARGFDCTTIPAAPVTAPDAPTPGISSVAAMTTLEGDGGIARVAHLGGAGTGSIAEQGANRRGAPSIAVDSHEQLRSQQFYDAHRRYYMQGLLSTADARHANFPFQSLASPPVAGLSFASLSQEQRDAILGAVANNRPAFHANAEIDGQPTISSHLIANAANTRTLDSLRLALLTGSSTSAATMTPGEIAQLRGARLRAQLILAQSRPPSTTANHSGRGQALPNPAMQQLLSPELYRNNVTHRLLQATHLLPHAQAQHLLPMSQALPLTSILAAGREAERRVGMLGRGVISVPSPAPSPTVAARDAWDSSTDNQRAQARIEALLRRHASADTEEKADRDADERKHGYG